MSLIIPNGNGTNKLNFEVLKTDTISRLREMLQEDPRLLVKIGDRWEITRPVALGLLNLVKTFFNEIDIREKFERLDESAVVIKMRATFRHEGKSISVEMVAACERKEKRTLTLHEMVTIAETRATKRLIEWLVGEDVINAVIKEITEPVKAEPEPTISEIADIDPFSEEMATEAQIRKIHVLKRKLGISDEEYRAALMNYYGVSTSKALTKRQASNLIERMERRLKEIRA